jgi:hypothetical protein
MTSTWNDQEIAKERKMEKMGETATAIKIEFQNASGIEIGREKKPEIEKETETETTREIENDETKIEIKKENEKEIVIEIETEVERENEKLIEIVTRIETKTGTGGERENDSVLELITGSCYFCNLDWCLLLCLLLGTVITPLKLQFCILVSLVSHCRSSV